MNNRPRFYLLGVLIVFVVVLNGCGSDSIDFNGTWEGSLTRLDNRCPFTVNQNLGAIFPMQVNEDAAGVITVTAANGDIATGGQGLGETISFEAKGNSFGSYGSSAPYSCTVSPFTVGYLTQGDNSASVNIFVTFKNCTVPGQTATVSSCSITYSGDATRR